MAIARLVCKRLKVAAGISTTADIHERERVSVRCEVGAADVVRIGNVRSQREDHRRLLWRAIKSFRQIQRRIEFNVVAHWNLNAPSEIVICGRSRSRRRRRWRLRLQHSTGPNRQSNEEV